MQNVDGTLSNIEQQTFDRMIKDKGDSARVVTVGDKFKIRGCFFVVTSCGSRGITANGITREEYFGEDVNRRIGRNEKCPCGSDKKYKKCCGVIHEVHTGYNR